MESPYTVAAAVLATVADALEACGRAPGVSLVAAGGIIVDDCCVGRLTVAPERTYRSIDPFPTEAGPDASCAGGMIGVDLVIRFDECIRVLTDAGEAPPVAEQQAAYQSVLEAAAIIWTAAVSRELLGDDAAGDPLWERANVTQLYVGIEGGCIGSETRLTLGIPMSLWCPPCEPPAEVPAP